MKILLIGINFWPELVGAGKYSGELAKWLSEKGHDVRVVTAPPYYPQWRVSDGYSAWRYKRENFQDKIAASAQASPLFICRCPLWVPRRPSALKRLLHLMSFALSCFPALLFNFCWKPTAVMIIAPTFMSVPGGLLLARLSGARAWLHIQDFELDAAFDMGLLRSGHLRRLFTLVERYLLRKFDRVSTISVKMQDKLVEKGVSRKRTWLLPNWVDTDAIAPIFVENPFRAELGIAAGVVVALYSGNMGEKQGLEVVVEAARRLEDNRNLVFIMCGEGSARDGLIQMSNGLGNIFFVPLQRVDRLNELLNCADIHLLPQRADVADLVMPSKLTGMLASGRPVIATAAAGTQLAVVVRQCGLIVPPGDVGEFVKAISMLADDASARSEMGAKARTYAEANLGYEVILSRFESELLSLVKT